MTKWPTATAFELTWIDAPTMAEIDRVTIEDAGIVLMQMMENAGRSLAAVVRTEFTTNRALVLAGSGGNGGGGLVAARHLINAGVNVTVALTGTIDRLTPIPAHQFKAAAWMGATITPADAIKWDTFDVIIDAMVGYSLAGALRGNALEFAAQANARRTPVVSLDVPSGLSTANDERGGVVVNADATVTLCLPKEGLRGRTEVGRLFLADISVPDAVVRSVTGAGGPPFDRGPILSVAG